MQPPRRDQFNASGQGREVGLILRQIQDLTLELRELRLREPDGPELDSKEHKLERLRWRLAAVARRAATDDRDAAA